MKLFAVMCESCPTMFQRAGSREEALENWKTDIDGKTEWSKRYTEHESFRVKEIRTLMDFVELLEEGEKEFQIAYDGSF